MKLLLLTYSFNYNYGGLLQAYATVKYLQNEGHEVTVPNCHPAHMVGNTALLRGMGVRGGNPFRALIRRLRQITRYKRFDEFRRHLPLDRNLSSKNAIKARIEYFDVVLTGSDQTFNTKFMPSYEPYFYQGFIQDGVRKVSYASCFGTREQNQNILKHAAIDLAKFDALAVRNDVSSQIAEGLIGVKPTVVVDPTLLHDFNEFRLAPNQQAQSPFIMIYGLDSKNFPLAEAMVNEVRTRSPNIEVHFVNGEKNFDKPAWATHLINSYGPAEFLTKMQQASYVFTDSFHGVIFAQKFGRPCVAYSSGWRSERIISMMTDFCASDLLLLENDPARVKEVIKNVCEGARLTIGPELQRKIDISKTYLAAALAVA